ncbi:peptidoglycan-binding protein [Anaerobacillus isosaccharinicus]|nr:peptidoglycan-binding protein [Anaerobacillus isosaccharinicus]MBA5584402.1 peptidoglycan-binding protein [Anaerobacillus isosaccharinicus]QOY37206.1 peptidoglycan-binding protein [Anaerobacillus isosaccharinicus]
MERNYKKGIMTTALAAGVIFTGAATTDAALGDQPLAPGMRHQDVKELQDVLKQKGFFTYHTSTGFYGDITKQAVERFQQANQLAKTGVVDNATLTALTKPTVTPNQQTSTQQPTVPTQPAPTQQPATPQPTLKVGSRGQAVTNLQNALKQAGVFHTNPTGYYGPITEKAIRDFQTRNGLTATGIADSTTQTALTRKIQQPPQTPSTQTSRSQQQPALSIGSRGQAVIELQRLLDEAKFFAHHTYTGYYGEVTAKGIREFQKKVQLPTTGIADARTIDTLRNYLKKEVATPQTEPKPPTQQGGQPITLPTQPTQELTQPNPITATQPETSFLLKRGSTGEAVRELQHQLKVLGLLQSEVTGTFGQLTEDAVKKFQQQHNLIADGLATTKTLQLLVQETTKQLLPAITLPSETRDSFHIINLIADASQLLGTPYQWGGTTSTGFDCSGFIQYVFQKNTVQLPRTVAQMWEVGTPVEQLQVGDLVFFETYMPGPSHAGIYIGNNQFIHSGTTAGVSISSLTSSYYSQRYLGAKRYY